MSSAVPNGQPPGQQPGTPMQPQAPAGVAPELGRGSPYEAKTPWTAYIKPVLWTLVALYVVFFVFLNREIVVINFVFFQASVPLIFVLVGLALIGGVLGAGVMVATRRRAQKKAELAAAQAAMAAQSGKKKK